MSSKAYLLPLMLLTLAVCESHRAEIMPSAGPIGEPSPDALSLLKNAQEALAEGDHDRCALHFAGAARVSTGDQAATYWYRAAQCASRAFDFRTSRFYLEEAVGAGYANMEQLLSDPLLQPLQVTSRWPLILDRVRENEKKRGQEARQPDLSLGPGGPATNICEVSVGNPGGNAVGTGSPEGLGLE